MSKSLALSLQAYQVTGTLTAAMAPLALVDNSAIGGGPPVTILGFTMQRQVQSQWCWAATSTSVSLFYNAGSSWTQCLVAQQVTGNTCCINPMPCNHTSTLSLALRITGNLLMQAGRLTFQQVEAELTSDRVVGARIGWFGGGGHSMVIYGCEVINGVNYYYIDDPIYGKSQISENGFNTAYQGTGSWTHSYTTTP